MYCWTNIAYELPSTVKSLNDGWLTTFQSSTVVAGLFAVVEVRILSFVKNDASFARNVVGNSAKDALLIFTYLGLFFSVSAAVSGLILTDDFGELPVRASRQRDSMELGLFDSGTSELLQSYGAKRSWIWVMWHWLFSLIAGTLSLTIQVLIYVSLEESKPVRITLAVITVFAVLPLVHLVPLSSGRRKRYSSGST
ncbi:hypothetical protein EDB92DRAFT_1976220 [Lactarius akahatsu]|uniref:Uncharacterized protein n=1 Tax=Lactarius akahatsu TaxID=416441 RepID=A0AAD4L4Q4_9AGAM|nr:hypothetical protein EDB92DRAFT_1976220 [Lactarius akahatsu]